MFLNTGPPISDILRSRGRERDTARIDRVPKGKEGWLLRLARWQTRRRFKRDLEPLEVIGHHPWTLAAVGAFEMALERSRLVEGRLKELAQIKAATLVGCPF